MTQELEGFERLNDRQTEDECDQLKIMYMQEYPLWACVVADVPVMVQTHTRSGLDLRHLTEVGATDGRTIYFLPEFWRKSTISTRVAVFAHECEHIARMHSLRMMGRDPRLWNVACDHTINLSLTEDGKTLPDGGCCDPKYTGWDEERIYADLESQCQDQDQNGTGASPFSVVVELRNEDGSPVTQQQIEEIKSEMNSKIKMAVSMAKRAGKDGATEMRSLSELVEPKRNWREELRLFVSSSGTPIGRTWTRLERRPLVVGLWVPAQVKSGIDWVVVGFDVSGSTSQRETDAFISNVEQIRRTMPIKRMTVVPFNHGLIEEDIFDLKFGTRFKKEFSWGGGTYVQPVFDWIQKQSGKPNCVMIFSDMEFDYDLRHYGISPLWVSTTPLKRLGGVPSFGRVIEIGV